MKEKVRFLGMDVHAEAIAEPDGEVRILGTILNRMESVSKLLKKLGPVEKLRSLHISSTDKPGKVCQGRYQEPDHKTAWMRLRIT